MAKRTAGQVWVTEPLPPTPALLSLLLATFVVAAGYGLLLPILPELVRQLAPDVSKAAVLHHTGLATATYAGGALVAAPIAGRLADLRQQKAIIVAALVVSALATLATSLAASLTDLYVLRFLAGLSAGTFGPAAQSWLSRWSPQDDEWISRRLVLTSLAATAGLFTGPVVGGLIATVGVALGFTGAEAEDLALIGGSTLSLATALTVAVTLGTAPAAVTPRPRWVAAVTIVVRSWRLFLPLMLVAVIISAYEVALAFLGDSRQTGMQEIGLLFGVCTAVMFLAQAALVLPKFRNKSWVPLQLPAFGLMAAGLILLAIAAGPGWHFLAVALVATGGGVIPPILAREIAALDRGAGGTMAALNAATGLVGQIAGAALASLVAVAGEPAWVFLVAAVLLTPAALALTQTTGRSARPIGTR